MWSIVMIFICSLWFLTEILINILTRSRKSESNSYDQNSLRIIWIVIISSIAIGVYIAFSFARFNVFEYFFGISFIVTGIAIRFIAIFSLKSLFNSNVSIHYDHKLKTDGIFKKIRHPSYSGSLLSFLGLGLTLGNWISLVIIFLPILGAFLYRINVEEEALTKNFREEYLIYMKRTKKLIPYLF